MAFLVRAVFDDGSSKIVEYAERYDIALACLLGIADQRLTYMAPLPLLKSVQLIAGDRIEFEMRAERWDIGQLGRQAAHERLIGGEALVAAPNPALVGHRPRDAARPAQVLHMSAYRRPVHALDMLTRWEPSRADAAGFYSGLDNAAHTVRVMGSGVWLGRHADRYFEQQRRIVDQARRRFGPLKAFFDVRNWVVENPQSALQFQDMNSELYRPEDRLVAIVRSSADREHPRTALRGKNTEVFTSPGAGESWLQAAAG